MNGVLGCANLLLDTPLSAEQREYALTVQRSGDSLLTIINDLLDYSKIEAGRMTVEHIDYDLRAVCDEVRKILQPAIAEQGLTMSLSYDTTLPRIVNGDPVRIRQIVLNLAANAVKFTERGTVSIDVSRFDAAQVKISVVDSGIGISEALLDRMFRRFTQAGFIDHQKRYKEHRTGARHQQDSGGTHGRHHRSTQPGRRRLDVLVHGACRRCIAAALGIADTAARGCGQACRAAGSSGRRASRSRRGRHSDLQPAAAGRG